MTSSVFALIVIVSVWYALKSSANRFRRGGD